MCRPSAQEKFKKQEKNLYKDPLLSTWREGRHMAVHLFFLSWPVFILAIIHPGIKYCHPAPILRQYRDNHSTRSSKPTPADIIMHTNICTRPESKSQPRHGKRMHTWFSFVEKRSSRSGNTSQGRQFFFYFGR